MLVIHTELIEVISPETANSYQNTMKLESVAFQNEGISSPECMEREKLRVHLSILTIYRVWGMTQTVHLSRPCYFMTIFLCFVFFFEWLFYDNLDEQKSYLSSSSSLILNVRAEYNVALPAMYTDIKTGKGSKCKSINL